MERLKKATYASIGALLVGIAFVAPASAGEITTQITGEDPVVELFKDLTKSTNWQLVGKIKLKFQTYHPEGMVKIGDFFYLSSVEIIEAPERGRP